MKVTILDDYQEVFKKLDCSGLLNDHEPKILTKGYDVLDQLDAELFDSEASRIQAKLYGFNPASSQSDFADQSDVLTLHPRFNEQTQNCVSEQGLKLMKPETLS